MKIILIIYTGALGDILLTRPILFYLRRHFPNCQIDYAGNPGYLQAINTEIDKIYDFYSGKLLSLFSLKSGLESECRAWLESYDIILFWSAFQDQMIQTKLNSLKYVNVIYQSIKPPPGYQKHQTELTFSTLKLLGIYKRAEVAKFQKKIPQIAQSKKRTKQKLICIHPGSGSKEKNLPIEIYRQMEKDIREKTGFRIIFILGPAEKSFLVKVGGCEFVTPETISELKELLVKSKYYIGNDSGVTHLAAQLGIPTFAIFLATNPVIWAPIGDHVHIIHNQKDIRNRFYYQSELKAEKLVGYFLEKIFLK